MGLNKKIDKQIARMPKYKINKEAFETQNIARSRAFRRDRSIQLAEGKAEGQAASDIAQASDVTDSTSGLLSTIANINANTLGNKQDLAIAESGIQRQNTGDLYQANQAVIDEKDKAFYQNEQAPWEAKLRGLQQKKANRNQFWTSTVGGLLSAVGGNVAGVKNAFGGGGGGAGGGGF